MKTENRYHMSTCSLAVFDNYIRVNDDGTMNVDGLLSKECFTSWLGTRLGEPKHKEEAFRKAITAHCRGVDGRKPFPRSIEMALLIILRQKKVWPCFQGSKCRTGSRGFQALGYWEKKDYQLKYGKPPPASRRKMNKEGSNKRFKQSTKIETYDSLDLLLDDLLDIFSLAPDTIEDKSNVQSQIWMPIGVN